MPLYNNFKKQFLSKTFIEQMHLYSFFRDPVRIGIHPIEPQSFLYYSELALGKRLENIEIAETWNSNKGRKLARDCNTWMLNQLVRSGMHLYESDPVVKKHVEIFLPELSQKFNELQFSKLTNLYKQATTCTKKLVQSFDKALQKQIAILNTLQRSIKSLKQSTTYDFKPESNKELTLLFNRNRNYQSPIQSLSDNERTFPKQLKH